MIIRYVSGEVIVFEIDNKLYYFHDSPNLPQVYDQQLNKLIIPNLDSWIQSQTGQRHSLRGLRDMAAAFSCGVRCGISDKQGRQLISNVVIATKQQIFHSALASGYARAYFIELLDPIKIESAHLHPIAKNFDKLLKKCGPDRFYNYLCRFWQLCNQHSSSMAAIFENMIKRLNKQPTTPQYPTTTELDNNLVAEVHRVVLKNLSLYNVPDEIVHNTQKLK